MSDRVASDGDGVTAYRARVARSGGTRRPCLRLPKAVDLGENDVIRLVLDGTECHAPVVTDADGRLLRGAYDNRRLARTDGEGENRLVAWLHGVDRGPGESVEFDEVTPGYLYGVRVPGNRAIYEVTRRPDPSLSSIAEDLE